MPIQVLKVGVLPTEVKYHFMCGNCKTEFVATREDGLLVDDRDGAFLSVKCPTCDRTAFSSKKYSDGHRFQSMYDLAGR